MNLRPRESFIRDLRIKRNEVERRLSYVKSQRALCEELDGDPNGDRILNSLSQANLIPVPWSIMDDSIIHDLQLLIALDQAIAHCEDSGDE